MMSPNNYSRTLIEIKQTVKTRVPLIPFAGIARAVLNERYVLSLVICGDTLARRINRTYRKKDYSPNVLSFPLGEYEGEIFLNVRCAEREARAAKMNVRERIALLFAHGCLHLRGLRHGTVMENMEKNILKKFGF
ncbi:MAG: rRNA maturation RNase YbeY [bacterium]|nr:rRNA maturation RNase YbeY [bacterium]